MNAVYRNAVLLWIAYDGGAFHGMAHQPHLRTVASEVQGAILAIDMHASRIRHVSRTDAGVHANQQVVAYDTSQAITPRGWVLALTQHLPADIAVCAAAVVPVGFDPRSFVISKTYRYRILQSPVRDPFLEGRAWRIRERLNHELMLAEAADLVGYHDFAAFRCAQDRRLDTRRNITSVALEFEPTDTRVFWWVVVGDGFLMHMVRIIVGTLVDVGRERIAPGACKRALTSLFRRDLGITAPPIGLFLHEVKLRDSGTDRWPQVDDSTAVT